MTPVMSYSSATSASTEPSPPNAWWLYLPVAVHTAAPAGVRESDADGRTLKIAHDEHLAAGVHVPGEVRSVGGEQHMTVIRQFRK